MTRPQDQSDSNRPSYHGRRRDNQFAFHDPALCDEHANGRHPPVAVLPGTTSADCVASVRSESSR